MLLRLSSILMIAFLIPIVGSSQCNTNISICTPGQAGPFNFAPGSANPSTCLDFINGQAAPNYAYIILYITQGGNLDLLVQGNNGGVGCLDVSIFDITNVANPCASLSPATEIACNYVNPCIGCAEFGNQIGGCGAQIAAPFVNTGDVVMILVEDWSDVQNSFTLNLGNGPNSAETGPPDATIQNPGAICNTDPAFQMFAADNGGVWSGPGITPGGIFNPGAVGPGTYNINYSIGSAPCNDQDSYTITVNNCSICNIDYADANISACNPATNSYTITGVVEFVNPPASGSLVAEDCNGTIYTLDPFPFPASGTVNYTIPNLPADGSNCSLIFYFTADPACQLGTLNYTAPTCPCMFIDPTDFYNYSCDPADNTFDLDGILYFQYPPTTGVLTVSDCNGNSQTFNPPFVSPINFSLSGIDSDGTLNCTLTAQFSADPACLVSSLPFNYPDPCVCDSDAGTFTDGTIGATNATGPFELCFGDQLNINANGDYSPPQFFPNVASTYDPGMWLAFYDCPPSNLPPTNILTDPCYLGIASTNDQAWSILNNSGDGSTIYFVPITMYSMQDGVYAISINGGDWCYDMGPAYEVTFLPEITQVLTQDCNAGTATTTLNGGMPTHDGSNYSIVPGSLVPANASFVNTTAPSGGTITISGLLDGDNYSFDVVDSKNCPITISGTFTGVTNSAFTYPDNSYCFGEPNPVPTITGVAGGTFTSTPPGGLSINAGTGVINLAASLVGAYTITYSSPGFPCNSQSTFDLIINALPVVNVPSDAICTGGSTTLTASGANTYTWSPSTGLSATTGASVTANPGATQVYTIVGANSTGCENTTTATVTVNPLPTISGTFDVCVGSNQQLTGSAAPNAVNPWQSSNPAVATVNATGLVTGISAGTTTITYTNSNGCQGTQLFTVHTLPVVSANDESLCSSETVVLTATGADTYTWAPALNLSSTTGTSVTFTPGSTTNYTVTGTDVNGCVNSDAVTVTVFANPPVATSADVAICNGESTIISANGAISYTWNQGLGIGSSHTVSPTVTTIYTVIGTDGNGCTNSDNVTVTVNQLPIVFAGQDQTICIGEGVTLTGQGAVSYVWTAPVVNGVEFFPNTTASYNVEGTDINGCKNDDDVIVVVNPLPIVNAGNDIAGCNGDNFVLTGSGAGASGTYDWDNGVTNGIPFTPPTGTTTYTVVGTDANGCENTDQLVVFIQDPPAVSFTYVQDGFCIPATVTFTNTTVPMGVNCIWNFDDGTVINGCGPVITHTFTSAGQFGASLQTETAANGCVASVYYPNIIFVEANPVANFSADPTTTTTIATEVQFANESTGATSYVWDFGDESPTSTLVNPSHQFTENEPGNYNVMLIARSPLGCADTAYRIIRVSEELIFYVPNTFTPDGDSYNETFTPVFTSGFDPYDYNLQIYNRWGEIVFESNDASIGWAGNYGVDGNRCQDGVYNWKIEFKTTSTDERKIINGHVNLMR